MIRQLSPRLEPGCYIFRRVTDETDLVPSLPMALGIFRETDGISIVAPAATDAQQAMRLIPVQVMSALAGVGLTAGP